jgi:hypothetical protein
MINDKKHPVTGSSSYVVDLKPDSPSLWHLQLQAISEECGTNQSEAITFETKYNDNPPVNNCFETTGNAISVDLGALSKLQNPTSDFVTQIWIETSKLYGGTPKFTTGILNDLNSYLTGLNNSKLESEFLEILTVTANRIIEIDRENFKDDFARLVQMFSLQLRLFYNVLGCQDAEVIKEYGDMLKHILDRIAEKLGMTQEDKQRALYNSFMISADMAHSIHPNQIEKHDPVLHPVMNSGPVIKIHANQKYTTDGDSGAVFKTLCKMAGVPVQQFVNRSDMVGGSTLGNVLTGQLDIRSVDVGNPMLSMHSVRELSGVKDHLYMTEVFRTFFNL